MPLLFTQMDFLMFPDVLPVLSVLYTVYDEKRAQSGECSGDDTAQQQER